MIFFSVLRDAIDKVGLHSRAVLTQWCIGFAPDFCVDAAKCLAQSGNRLSTVWSWSLVEKISLNVNLKSIRIFKARLLPPLNDDRQTWMLFNIWHIVIELWSVKKQQTTNKLSAEDQLARASHVQRTARDFMRWWGSRDRSRQRTWRGLRTKTCNGGDPAGSGQLNAKSKSIKNIHNPQGALRTNV